MAGRKLQGEIERVLKKVDEGVGIFEQIWDKVYSATTTAQKEKYEGDLKKEIKKLQRLRDQIKTWQGDSSIKDKTKLDANRKLIEEKMEKFKICEKETKTKAFSKEGLAQDRTDPKQKAKAGVNEWVREAISSLKEQSDEMEAEIETLNSGKRKKRGEENPRVSDLKEHIARHEYHVEMLERVLRAVYNDAVTPDEASDLKESVDYYIESNQDPDFFEDDEMYDMLNLEAPSTTVISKKKEAKPVERDEDDDNTPSGTSFATPNSKKGPASPRNTKGSRTVSATASSKLPVTSNRIVSPKNSRVDEKSPTIDTHSPRSSMNVARDTSSHRHPNAPLMSTVVKGSVTSKPVVNAKSPSSTNIATFDPHHARQSPPRHQQPDHSLHLRRTPTPLDAKLARDGPHTAPGTVGEIGEQKQVPADGEKIQSENSDSRAQKVAAQAVKVNPKLNAIDPKLAALEASLAFMPEMPLAPAKSGLSARNTGNGNPSGTVATPRNPVATPPSFPAVPAPVFDNRQIFEKFDPDTLFFIFYYQQGTYQQYLAARELKRQGWRFHKKYLTWFQRHDEPKLSTDEYETGTFIYFDYANVVVHGQGTGWCQRIKSEFVFEYRFLEDELV